MSRMSFATASIVGLILETLLYGMGSTLLIRITRACMLTLAGRTRIFIPLFLTACYLQWRRRVERHSVNMVMVFATAFYGLTITAHWVLSFTNGLNGIFFLPPGEDSEAYFENFANHLSVSKLAILEIQGLVTDCIMIYRMYHIYNRNITICILPLICSLIHIVHGFGTVIQTIRNHGSPASAVWVALGFSVMTFNSLYIPSFIPTRLWRTHSLLSESGIRISKSLVMRAMYVFIESAVLWTASIVLNFAMYLARSSGLLTTADLIGPVIGISFCLIIVRLGHAKERFSLPTIKTPNCTIPTTVTMTAFSTSRSTSREDLQQERDGIKTQCGTVGQPAIA